MLFLAAAILSASIHLSGVVVGPAVPVSGTSAAADAEARTESPATAGDARAADDHVAVDDRAESPTVPAPEQGPVPSALSDDCGAAEPTGCLAALATASEDELDEFARSLDASGDDTGALVDAVASVRTAAVVSSWWAALDPSRQLALVARVPGLVGNLEGVPYTARDDANRLFLVAARAAVDERRGTGDERRDDDARAEMLGQVAAAVGGRAAGDAERHLVALDTVLPGRAAVSVGDLDTADDVSVLVPGMFFTVGSQLVDWTDTAGELYDEQRSWTYLLARADSSGLDQVAVVAWLGYRTPDLTNVYGLDLARAGADRLEDAITGLDATRASSPARVTVVAHSYGSTTATLALSAGAVSVDSLVLLGSPGSVVPSASMLDVAGDDVYAAAGSFDPVAGSGYFGADPGTAGFGAVLLHTGGGADDYTGRALAAALGHNSYLVPGTETMRSTALIGLGRGDMVDGEPGDPRPVAPEAPDLSLVRPQDLYVRD
ncbi:hypothetical protein ES689_11210 [Frigoribacterium sp. ACAM 257]|uniref:alpha/beta hydrolase n=1 Tax=Frigoribacterium sp. ACAM 257 TaxID=2508998 RepID=UPI0011B94DA0|nr:alpha/beta hydrolase [Frigoribacterium sp. ACAM 257]TWX37227.1 hypothetical protein ES689_11210 [Frigoribacterium sp. ACAM 257]